MSIPGHRRESDASNNALDDDRSSFAPGENSPRNGWSGSASAFRLTRVRNHALHRRATEQRDARLLLLFEDSSSTAPTAYAEPNEPAEQATES